MSLVREQVRLRDEQRALENLQASFGLQLSRVARRRPRRVVSGAGDGVRPRAEWPGCASTAALQKLEEEFEAQKTARAIDPVPKPKDDDGTKS